MADNKEEEYLDALLNSMLNGEKGDDGKASSSLPIDEDFDLSEDDDMMMLSKMLLDDNDISYDDDEEEEAPAIQLPKMEHSDMESFLSLDDLLNSATNNSAGDIGVPKEEKVEDSFEEILEESVDMPTEETVEASLDEVAEEPEITPIISDEIDPFSELDFGDDEVAFTDLESLMNVELANINEESGEDSGVVSDEPEEEKEQDFFSDFDEISTMFSNESSSVNEEELRRSLLQGEEKEAHDDALEKELAAILALDDGMSISDIPDEQPESMLTEEEKLKVQGIEMPSEETETTEKEGQKAKKAKKTKKVKEPKPKKEKKEKKEKKAKKSKQTEETEATESVEETEHVEKASKPAKKAKPAKEPKPAKEKSKFSFKEFFAKFNDEEDEDNDKKKAQVDNNQKLIDELYKGKDSLDDEEVDEDEKGKKGKKGKKEKKQKTPKPKKEKAPKDPSWQEKIKIGKFGGFIIVLLIIVFLFGGFFGVRFINYQLTINSSKKYFEMGNYDLAYDKLSGIDVMKKDSKLYNGIRTVMIVYQGYTSYNNYVEIDREAEALDALINAVGRKQQVESDAILYDVTKEVNVAYEQIMTILAFYGIDEQMALDLYMMTDYAEYYEILHSYEGVAK